MPGRRPRGAGSSPAVPADPQATLLTALPPVGLHVATLALVDPARHLGLFLLLMALGWGWLCLIAGPTRWRRSPSPGLVLGIAVLLRLLLIPVPPKLSDDLLRYLWDGKVVTAGENPYRHPPESPLLTPLRDELWERLPHKEVATVYPPLALATFGLAARMPFPVLSLKAILSAADLLTCILLLRLAATVGLPTRRVLWYAWNPLVTFEVAGMGHVDALGVTASVAVVLLLVRRPPRPVGAALAAAAGVLAKLVPLVALPLWSRMASRRRRFLAPVALLLAVSVGALWWVNGGVPTGLVRYGVSWEFNGPLFEPLWRILHRAGAVGAIKSGLDHLREATASETPWIRLYPFVYPQLLAKLLLAGTLVGVAASGLRGRAGPGATGRIFGGALLCSATFYPWYLLWVLPWAALAEQPAWLALGALLPLTYLAQPGPLPLWPGLWAAVWLPFFFLAFRCRRWSID